MVPAVSPGEWDIELEMDVTRNTGNGVELLDDGSLRSQELVPIWASIPTLAVRFGLFDGLGLELRGITSAIFPFAFPIPNGLSLSPMIRVARLGPDLDLHAMPRALWLRAQGVGSAGTGSTLRVDTDTLGFELPLLLDWKAADWVHLNGTAFGRSFYLNQTRARGGDTVKGSWLAFGGGLTANAIMTFGWFRLGLGLGIEVAPNPGAAYPTCTLEQDPSCKPPPQVHFIPQGGLSLGVTWK
jgi:hypothetical protein